jgi:DNA-binding beta-propeller fold protein YncE
MDRRVWLSIVRAISVTNGPFNATGGVVEKFSPTGVDLGAFASTGLSGPVALAVDHAGNVYVANYSGDTIQEFSPTGNNLGGFATGPGPSGIAILVTGASVPEPSSLVTGLLGLGLLGGHVVSRHRRA